MINILPQVDKMNRGAWLQTEMIIECLREEEVLTILGGAVYPSGTLTGNFSMDTTFAQRDDWFLRTHGVTNPHYFWKAILADPNGRYKDDFGIIAFWIPNTAEATLIKSGPGPAVMLINCGSTGRPVTENRRNNLNKKRPRAHTHGGPGPGSGLI